MPKLWDIRAALPNDTGSLSKLGYAHDSNEAGRIVEISNLRDGSSSGCFYVSSVGDDEHQDCSIPKVRAFRAGLKLGIHKHYKGHYYLTLGYGIDQDRAHSLIVVYIGLELTNANTGPRLAIRTANDFLGNVCANRDCSTYGRSLRGDICTSCESSATPRFAYIGASWEGFGYQEPGLCSGCNRPIGDGEHYMKTNIELATNLDIELPNPQPATVFSVHTHNPGCLTAWMHRNEILLDVFAR